MEDLIKTKSCETVTIPQERYEYLVALESRVDAAVTYMSNVDFCSNETVLRIIGTTQAKELADRMKKKEEALETMFKANDKLAYTE